MRTAELVWVLESREYTAEDLALTRLAPVLSHKIDGLARDKGLSYGARFGFNYCGKWRVCIARLPLSNHAGVEDFVSKELAKQVGRAIVEVSDSELTELSEVERLRQLAMPIRTEDALRMALFGLTYFGRCIDADRVKQMYQEVSMVHLREWRDRIVEYPPAVFIM